VPNLRHRSFAQEAGIVARAGFSIEQEREEPTADRSLSGKIMSQNPRAGSKAKSGTLIRVAVSL
jgi:beta-lactam-binding protein with PASTA domain